MTVTATIIDVDSAGSETPIAHDVRLPRTPADGQHLRVDGVPYRVAGSTWDIQGQETVVLVYVNRAAV
ncbi:hypothetical protein L6E12_28740 [Actinokineospora sp. PR83]|uniref:hypothetical protein n=1 Tax=Actinokineospora sp. PR83 TaxID=2884908 RepID=UPI001F2C08F2|nr:hypothetical protein [Actinokineospora sp. PR83]MCG8919768.1 hypothetical protein [Actinokineospora sp. PR83]